MRTPAHVVQLLLQQQLLLPAHPVYEGIGTSGTIIQRDVVPVRHLQPGVDRTIGGYINSGEQFMKANIL